MRELIITHESIVFLIRIIIFLEIIIYLVHVGFLVVTVIVKWLIHVFKPSVILQVGREVSQELSLDLRLSFAF